MGTSAVKQSRSLVKNERSVAIGMTTSMATIHGNLQKQPTMSRIDDSSITKHEDGRRLTNYVAFTSKMVVGVAIDSNNYRDSDDESTEDFVNSYNLMLGISSTFVLWDSSRVL
ncbi:hypothetical protein V6N11_042519 [Hibiscus sabdariffa]|uniref:Uncharacterized protein n=1 Tax=Hibiscus sabdariffa TaxID=183260 RepID=A0ABR2QWJ7_9ROSI